MPATVTDAFGNVLQVCSISTMIKAKTPKSSWDSEAQWAKHVKTNAFYVLRQKILNGEIKKNTVIARGPSAAKLVYKGDGVLEYSYKGVKKLEILGDFENSIRFKGVDWDFGPNMAKLAQQQKMIVDTPAKLKAYLKQPDADVDLDDVVLEIKSGTTGSKYVAKFDGFDDAGNPKYKYGNVESKLTIDISHADLENFAKASHYQLKYKVGQTPPAVPQPAGMPVASTSKSVGALTNEDAATMFVKTKDELAKQAGINIKGASKLDDLVYKTIADQAGYTPAEMKAKVAAYKATGKKLSSLKKKVLPKNGNPTKQATQTSVNKAADAVKKEQLKPEEVVQVWDDEAVAKAYIQAKDAIVADNNMGWTLYTKSPSFDNAILKKMQEALGPIKKDVADTAIANYIANTQKLSVLKKQMIKKGELKPQAPTLKGAKKSPGQQAVDDLFAKAKPAPDTSKSGVGKVGEDPSKIHPKQQLTNVEKAEIQEAWEAGNMPLSASGEKIYNFAKTFSNKYGHGDDVLPVLRWVDEYKAKKFGVQNKNLYEKKVLEYLANPKPTGYVPPTHSSFTSNFLGSGQSFGELPEDSSLFRAISHQEMTTIWRNQMGSISSQQQAAVRSYTGSYYHEVNTALRGGQRLENTRLGHTIQSAMKPLPENIISRRGTSLQGIGVNSYEELYQSIGRTFVEPGFSSTAVGGSGQFSGQVNLVIQVPKGAKAVWAKPYSMYDNENELLLAAGTRYRILKVEVQDGGGYGGKKTIVHVRVEP